MRVLVPLPELGFDPTEVAVPWRALTDAGHELVFATPEGQPSTADPRLLGGRGLGPLRPWLQARPPAQRCYRELEADPAFCDPLPYPALAEGLAASELDGLWLTGGHAEPMRRYLEASQVHALALRFMGEERPVAAIGHGVLILARAVDPDTRRSVLYGRKTAGLSKRQEQLVWLVTAPWLGSYYRPNALAIADELHAALASPDHLVSGRLPLRPVRPDQPGVGLAVRDGRYVSGRALFDTYRVTEVFAQLLAEQAELRTHLAAERHPAGAPENPPEPDLG